MNTTDIKPLEEKLHEQLRGMEPSKGKRIIRKLIMAALGSIPWVGGFLAALQSFKEEGAQLETNALQRQWLEEHKIKMGLLARDLAEITERLDKLGEEIQTRMESEEYLILIKKAFRIWDQADTEQKRGYIKRLIANAGATALCSDDLIRLFLDWLDLYHETHFAVIREIYKNPGITRYEIWEHIHGIFPRDDSSEADLFRLLIGDLSTGRIIRQHREVNYHGQFVKKVREKKSTSSGTLKSAFDDEEPYELTELGKQFVHYVFTDVVVRLENENTVTQP